MADDFDMMAPNGRELQGTLEEVGGAAAVVFLAADGSDFDHSGGTEIFWDGMTTQNVAGDSVFIDDFGTEWLQHHLIPVDAEPLSAETLQLFSREYHAGLALDAAQSLDNRLEVLSEEPALINDAEAVEAIRNRLRRLHRDARAASIAAKERDLAAQRAESEAANV